MQSILDIPTEKLTPGMRQYQDAKKENPDCIILLRMGDFYELFYEDAITASRELEITLTARGKGEKRAPLAGVPYHALETYLTRLVKKGYKVAIVEQLEDPKLAKGLVKRGVVRIVTPGTIIESSMLDEKSNNYIASIFPHKDEFNIALADISTGEFITFTTSNILQELVRFSPSEVVIPTSLQVNKELTNHIKQYCYLNTVDDFFFRKEKAQSILEQHFNQNPQHVFGITNLSVCGGLLQYLHDTQRIALQHIKSIKQQSNTTMSLDASTFRNLELIKNLHDNSSKNTLISVIDKTTTAMGARLLKKWIKTPLLQKQEIQQRHEAVKELTQNIILREEIALKQIQDIERLIARINYGNASPKDLLSLRFSLEQLPPITKLSPSSELLTDLTNLPDLTKVTELLQKSIHEEASISIRDGNIIKPTYNNELLQLTELKTNAKKFLQELEEREKTKTGIPLKIGYNRVFGYYIEITKKYSSQVPESYIRKQTTANAERYITEELKVEEEKILNAQEKTKELEFNIFQEILQQLTEVTPEIQTAASKIAALDVLISFSKVASEQNYIQPTLVDENVIQIKNGRHPVVELETRFIANNIMLQDSEMMIITGPNMAGKSTVLRQVALIVLLAQIGSFVPAEECVMGITDRIFTRVGAADDLAAGRSTFMVEMNETASILHNATERSLIILDEIGRGTSTFDGVSIAWSVAEYIYNHLKAKTMFATHYHVMNKLEDKFERITNYNIAVKERSGELIFLRKLIRGGTDQSYGVHVAKLAGLPEEVISRAKEIQGILEQDDDMIRKIKVKKLQEQKSLGEF